jgi:hypothetical protein
MSKYCDDPFLVDVIKVTDNAAFLNFIYDDEQHWIPFSQIEDNGESLEEGEEDVEVYLTEWIAKTKGLY